MTQAHLRNVYVVSAPSGGGKTTLNRRLMDEFPDRVEISVSLTTRKIRPGEQNGLHYHFVTEAQFQAAIQANEMLEWALVHGNLYGTSIRELEAITARNHSAILEIDVQGWETARHKLKQAVSVFILPPSIDALWQRLSNRGTDELKTRVKRIRNARDEIAAARNYQYFIINDDLERAYRSLKSIIIDRQAGDIDTAQGVENCRKLLEEFDSPQFQEKLRL
jgi:guanylate kinase